MNEQKLRQKAAGLARGIRAIEKGGSWGDPGVEQPGSLTGLPVHLQHAPRSRQSGGSMSKTKEAQATRIAELERQLRETQAQLVHVYSLASANLPKFGDCPGSAVVLTLSTLGGRETLGPIAIRDGLSQATIDALLADFVRSYEGAVALKPKGVKA